MKDVFYLLRLERLPWPYGLSQISGMAERILNWGGGGGGLTSERQRR